ncbi:hypothetical protein NLO413_0563 [Candidatus Neoehrlichia lotoris str. RAC413]|uniref:Uncharacterized protein n=1 Tax=Candidatus Neoehrlichia procyonis str. RAC413 TaxID=1359163 RepID=A0A0F3NN50_9RICK|nr:hypothetical protein NLO413_0563 [Candidatus Neoehrlichia lotoris str. RAC413]
MIECYGILKLLANRIYFIYIVVAYSLKALCKKMVLELI